MAFERSNMQAGIVEKPCELQQFGSSTKTNVSLDGINSRAPASVLLREVRGKKN